MKTPPKRFWIDNLDEKLQTAVDDYCLPDHDEFSSLQELAGNVEFKGVDVHGEAAIQDGGKLYAAATVFVSLIYGGNESEEDPVVFEDSYPARIHFSVTDDGEVEISRIDVDTSTFFE